MNFIQILFCFLVAISSLSGQNVNLFFDINPGSANGVIPLDLVDDKLFFQGNTDPNGIGDWELWKTEGTIGGTVLVKEFDPSSSGGGNPFGLKQLGNGKILFHAGTPSEGRNVWVTDGTSSGTQMIHNFSVGNMIPTTIGAFIPFNDGAIFYVKLDTISQLWYSDGTSSGTYELGNICENCSTFFALDRISASAVYNNELYFSVIESGIWKTDGTPTGTIQVFSDPSSNNLAKNSRFIVELNNLLYFPGRNSANTQILYSTDGTLGGTQEVYVFDSGTFRPSGASVFKNRIYFDAGKTLWVSDGTTGGTLQFSEKQVNLGSSPVLIWDDLMYIETHEQGVGRTLNRTLGYPSALDSLFATNRGDLDFSDGSPFYLIDGDNLYMRISDSIFVGQGGYSEAILHLKKGETSPNQIIKTNSFLAQYFFVLDDYLYFLGNDIEGEYGQEFYRVQINTTDLQTPEKLNPPQITPTLSKTGQFTLKTKQNQAKTGHISVYDLSGKLLHKQKVGEGQTDLDLSDLSSGFYIIQLLDAQGSLLGAQKVIIEK